MCDDSGGRSANESGHLSQFAASSRNGECRKGFRGDISAGQQGGHLKMGLSKPTPDAGGFVPLLRYLQVQNHIVLPINPSVK